MHSVPPRRRVSDSPTILSACQHRPRNFEAHCFTMLHYLVSIEHVLNALRGISTIGGRLHCSESHLWPSPPSESPIDAEEAALDIGGGADAIALSSIFSPGMTHRFNCPPIIASTKLTPLACIMHSHKSILARVACILNPQILKRYGQRTRFFL